MLSANIDLEALHPLSILIPPQPIYLLLDYNLQGLIEFFFILKQNHENPDVDFAVLAVST